MKEAYITVTGTHFRYGTEMVEKGDILYLKKIQITNTITNPFR